MLFGVCIVQIPTEIYVDGFDESFYSATSFFNVHIVNPEFAKLWIEIAMDAIV